MRRYFTQLRSTICLLALLMLSPVSECRSQSVQLEGLSQAEIDYATEAMVDEIMEGDPEAFLIYAPLPFPKPRIDMDANINKLRVTNDSTKEATLTVLLWKNLKFEKHSEVIIAPGKTVSIDLPLMRRGDVWPTIHNSKDKDIAVYWDLFEYPTASRTLLNERIQKVPPPPPLKPGEKKADPRLMRFLEGSGDSGSKDVRPPISELD